MALWQAFSAEDVFWDLPLAEAELKLAGQHGIDCEIIQCGVARSGSKQINVAGVGEFLGYDVAQPFSSCYSAIVDRCMGIWVDSQERTQISFATLDLVARHFNALLNSQRLFQDWSQAERFLKVDRECAAVFGGEMSCELSIIGVHLVR